MSTWYIMEDGSVGDPADIAADANGVLTHKDGRKVAYAPHGPRTRSVDVELERAKATPKREAIAPASREMKAKGGKGYETR